MAPLVLMAGPFGLIWGGLAVQKGLSLAEVLLMSALVFAGSAQFVALELWTDPLPLAGLVLATALVNARHLMMGAALGRAWPVRPRTGPALVQVFMADEVWALALRRAMGPGLRMAYYLGLAITLYLGWLLFSGLGALLGGLLTDPARYGADFAFTALFLVMIFGFCRDGWRGPVATLAPIAVAALVAILVQRTVPGHWSILAGAIAGCLAGAFSPSARGRT